MESVEFRCRNCGNRVEEELLSTKHTILGSAHVINRGATCCDNPEYEDNEGYIKARREQSIRDLIPMA